MGDTYIGPFGRILPVPEKSDTPPPGRTDPRMIASQVRLPLPTKLNFGSDPRPGVTDPRRYDSSSRTTVSRASSSHTPKHERLPSVNQLLTPASPLSPPEQSRRHKGEPLTPTEAAARHLYGWSKGYLEDLPNPHTGYFPAQGTTGGAPHPHTNVSGTQYPGIDRYPGSAMAPTDHGGSSYSPSNVVPHYSSPILAHGQYRPPFAPEYADGRRGSMSHPSPDSATTSKPVPKCLGEQIFPGEGPCFVYDDGTHVKKMIDGEQVNAQWGITKAGKPRKRLAIACLTCREKKIKCDPGEPKCVQCDKSGRECRFASA